LDKAWGLQEKQQRVTQSEHNTKPHREDPPLEREGSGVRCELVVKDT